MPKSVFRSATQAIEFYNCGNPARYKPINLIDSGSRTTDPGEYSLTDIWADVCLAFQKVKAGFGPDGQHAIDKYWRDDREIRWPVIDIAKYLHRHPRDVRGMLNEFLDDFEGELVRRELMDPKDVKKY